MRSWQQPPDQSPEDRWRNQFCVSRALHCMRIHSRMTRLLACPAQYQVVLGGQMSHLGATRSVTRPVVAGVNHQKALRNRRNGCAICLPERRVSGRVVVALISYGQRPECPEGLVLDQNLLWYLPSPLSDGRFEGSILVCEEPKNLDPRSGSRCLCGENPLFCPQ